MRNIRYGIAFALLGCGISAVASATGTQWTGQLTISSIEVVGNAGGFILYLTGFDDSNCSSNPTGIYVYPNSDGVSQSGADQMLAAALAARSTGATVSVFYDDTGSAGAGKCYGEYLVY